MVFINRYLNNSRLKLTISQDKKQTLQQKALLWQHKLSRRAHEMRNRHLKLINEIFSYYFQLILSLVCMFFGYCDNNEICEDHKMKYHVLTVTWIHFLYSVITFFLPILKDLLFITVHTATGWSDSKFRKLTFL